MSAPAMVGMSGKRRVGHARICPGSVFSFDNKM